MARRKREGQSRRARRAGPPPRTIVVAGAALFAVAAIMARGPARDLERLTVNVRPASPAETPMAEGLGGTVVASPDEGPSVLARVQSAAKRLAALALLASAGAGVMAWGVCLGWAARRRRRAGEEMGDREDGAKAT